MVLDIYWAGVLLVIMSGLCGKEVDMIGEIKYESKWAGKSLYWIDDTREALDTNGDDGDCWYFHRALGFVHAYSFNKEFSGPAFDRWG